MKKNIPHIPQPFKKKEKTTIATKELKIPNKTKRIHLNFQQSNMCKIPGVLPCFAGSVPVSCSISAAPFRRSGFWRSTESKSTTNYPATKT